MARKKTPEQVHVESPSEPKQVALEAPPEDSIGQRIQKKREEKLLNHDGLARLTKALDKYADKGINRTTIRGYELGMYKPGARELRLLSEALEVTPTWLLLGVDAESGKNKVATGRSKAKAGIEKLIRAVFLIPWLDIDDRDRV